MSNIRLSRDDFCIHSGAVANLKSCPLISAILKGQGLEIRRKFACLVINDKGYFADCITGTLFDANGEHHNDPHLKIVDAPADCWGGAVEVSA